jgi:beta-lactamase regulating signal transducer with metallopeptidase domain
MPLFLLKLSISLSIVWLFYQLFLRRLTFYRLNRWYLLGYTILAFFIPLINIGPMLADGSSGEPAMVEFIPAIGHVQANAVSPAAQRVVFSGWNGLLLLLLLGGLLLLIRSAVRWFSLLRLRRQARRVEGTELKIYQVDAPIIPFSFGNAIYINQRLHTEKEWSDIILHEYIHIRQRHTVDILLAELVCILNWYNPFSWLIRYSIRQNLEFIADQQVLDNGVDRKGYQYHLLKVVGEPRYRLANSFNFSSLKKRIVMMNKMRSARLHLLKLLFLVPLVAVLLLAFRDRYPDLLRRFSGPIYVNAAGIVIALPGKLPLAGVIVREKASGMETKTDAKGFYKMRIPVASDSARIHLDYLKEGYEGDYRERSWPVLKETQGLLEIGTMQPFAAPKEAGFFIAPSMDGHRPPVDPGYDDAVKELQRVLKENEGMNNFFAMEKEHPEVSLIYITEDKQRRIVIHTDGTLEKYGYPGWQAVNDMDKKYGALPDYMTSTAHPVNSGYLARWAGISAQAEKEFHATGEARAIIFPGDSRVIAVPVSGKPRVYDMDNDDPKERPAFEQLYGKLPGCVPGAASNTGGGKIGGVGSAGESKGAIVTGKTDTVPGGGRSRDPARVAVSGLNSDQVLYVVDGEKMPEGWKFDSIPPGEIKSIDVIKGEQAVRLFGERGVNGVVAITTKPGGKMHVVETDPTKVGHEMHPLYVIDGKEVLPTDTSGFRNLNPDQIQSIQVLKDSAAIRQYGEKGRNGVVIITLKKESSFAQPGHPQAAFTMDVKDGKATITADTVRMTQAKIVRDRPGGN